MLIFMVIISRPKVEKVSYEKKHEFKNSIKLFKKTKAECNLAR